jgi:hypothetical protein
MKEYTQTNLEPGNCWQTAVACVLDVNPDELPDQVEFDTSGKSYMNALNAYLEAHHGLIYSEIEDFVTVGLLPREPGWHVLIGPTVRTKPPKEIHHCIVGHYGVPIWDPHPSRAGLLIVRRWGIIAPLHDRIRTWRKEMMEKGSDWEFACVCRKCKPLVETV